MPRIPTPPPHAASEASSVIFEQIRKASGSVPNCFAAIGALRPAALKAILQADGVLVASSLSTQELETVKLVVSETARCDYCITAHSLRGMLAGLTAETVQKIRHGEMTGDARRDALVRFVRTLVGTTGTISDQELAQIKGAGYTDKNMVDISLAIAITTFTNVFNRVNDTPIDVPALG